MAIKFNGNDLPPFVKINNIALSLMPTIERTTIKVNGRNGSYDFGNTFDDREIEIDYTIIADNESDLRYKARDFANWLYTEEYAPLVILEEPDKYYMAKITGDTDFNEIIRFGQGSITFVAEPFLYGQEKEFDFNPTAENNTILVDNQGGLTAYPQIHLEFTEDTTSFALATRDEVMAFGTPVGIGYVPKNTNPLVLHDPMTAVTGWSTATTVDEGSVVGTFQVDRKDGHSFIQNTGNDDISDYGTGGKWHGASAIKALPKPIQDFKVQAEVGIKGNVAEHLGRVEVYLLDINGSKIGKIGMADTSKTANYPKAYARVGDLYGNHHVFVDTYGQWAGYWNNFSHGIMEIERVGNKWKAYFAVIDSNGKHQKTWETYYVDINNIATAQLAQIQIHVGAYGENTALNTLKFYDLKVYSNDQPTEDEIPIVFNAGDTLDIDSETGMILKNGQPFYSAFDPSSTFIKLEKGVNGISVLPAITTNGKIKFKERWL